jgi:hypothetical protein
MPVSPTLLQSAVDFMAYYVNGFGAPNAATEFPGSAHPGVVFRQPAMLDIEPELAPLADAADGSPFAAGVEGPEGDGPYLYLDRCPLRKAKITVQGDPIVVELIFVTVFPVGKFADTHPSVGNPAFGGAPNTIEVRPPSAVADKIAAECLTQLEGAIGTDENGATFLLGHTATFLTVDQFNVTEG